MRKAVSQPRLSPKSTNLVSVRQEQRIVDPTIGLIINHKKARKNTTSLARIRISNTLTNIERQNKQLLAKMCYYTLETYNACTKPDQHHPKMWLARQCIISHANKIQCPDIQYKPTLDNVPCPICHNEASTSREQIGLYSSTGPEFVGEFTMGVQIAHVKAMFDRRREEECARLCDKRFDGESEQ